MKKSIVLLLAAGLLSAACVKVDNSLGKGLVDKGLIFNTYSAEIPLEQTKLKLSEDLSGYSDTRITIGAIRDSRFGLTTRASAFTLIPALDTLDLGDNPQAISFDIFFEADTISCANDNQAAIMQNILVYELTEPLSLYKTGAMRDIPHGTQKVTKGTPVYDGNGALDFNFTKEFAQNYLDKMKQLGPVFRSEEADSTTQANRYNAFVKALPGIYIETDVPQGDGGRINMFNLSCLSVSNSYYYRNSNIALLKFRSSWKGVQKDSTIMFIPGETEFEDEASAITNNTKFYQYCFNHTSHSTQQVDNPTTELLVEGGTGLKPVISAKELREKTISAIKERGGNPENAIIVKATIELPYQKPEDYMDMKYFPSVLSPTIRTEGTSSKYPDQKIVAYAGLTDASVSTENQGDIDRSNMMYCPDITYHLQELLKREDLDTETNADIWLLTIHTQKVANANGSLYDNSYYQNLLYASYYNSLYGGGYGYGSYSGYGSYGYNSYSNYYNYMMLAQMMAASSQQTYSYNQELDKDRYYRAVLNGPAAERKPMFKVTFAFPEE